jgi:hypothetical protein
LLKLEAGGHRYFSHSDDAAEASRWYILCFFVTKKASTMRLLPSDPDVETIVSRIDSGDIDLQPEFQRGEVWGKLKKQRLIDSILRDWHVPPIHVIENPKTRKHEVLDGQQRLAAIRDFVSGHFPVNGNIEPNDSSIQALDGLNYRELPDDWRRRFNQFTIRLFRIVDYRSAEPAEIFFRLNQPTNLTGAEQRNAFFGPVREQIKQLVEALDEGGIGKRFLGFSNSRMAYDDVLSRTALAIQRNSLAEKITSADLADLYRSDQPLEASTVVLIERAISFFRHLTPEPGVLPKFNKATLFSWMMFVVRAAITGYDSLSFREFSGFLSFFEATRASIVRDTEFSSRIFKSGANPVRLFAIYDNRASARVADVSSVILRDAVLWLIFEEFSQTRTDLGHTGRVGINKLHQSINYHKAIDDDDVFARRLIDRGWGQLR